MSLEWMISKLNVKYEDEELHLPKVDVDRYDWDSDEWKRFLAALSRNRNLKSIAVSRNGTWKKLREDLFSALRKIPSLKTIKLCNFTIQDLAMSRSLFEDNPSIQIVVIKNLMSTSEDDDEDFGRVKEEWEREVEEWDSEEESEFNPYPYLKTPQDLDSDRFDDFIKWLNPMRCLRKVVLHLPADICQRVCLDNLIRGDSRLEELIIRQHIKEHSGFASPWDDLYYFMDALESNKYLRILDLGIRMSFLAFRQLAKALLQNTTLMILKVRLCMSPPNLMDRERKFDPEFEPSIREFFHALKSNTESALEWFEDNLSEPTFDSARHAEEYSQMAPDFRSACVDMLKFNYRLREFDSFLFYSSNTRDRTEEESRADRIRLTFLEMNRKGRMNVCDQIVRQTATRAQWVEQLSKHKDCLDSLRYYISTNPSICQTTPTDISAEELYCRELQLPAVNIDLYLPHNKDRWERFLAGLSQNRHLHKLAFYKNKLSTELNEEFFRALRKIPRLTTLNLGGFSLRDLANSRPLFQNNPSIEDLCVDEMLMFRRSNWDYDDDSGGESSDDYTIFNEILDWISSMRLLNKLELNIPPEWWYYCNLTPLVEENSRLKYLKIYDIGGYKALDYPYQNPGLQSLFLAMRSNNVLTYLNFDFELSFLDLKELARMLRHNTTLKDLKFSLDRAPSIDDYCEEIPFHQAFEESMHELFHALKSNKDSALESLYHDEYKVGGRHDDESDDDENEAFPFNNRNKAFPYDDVLEAHYKTIAQDLRTNVMDMLESNLTLREIKLFFIYSTFSKRDHDEINFFLGLNRHGRKSLCHPNAREGATRSQWVDQLSKHNMDVRGLYYYISANPSICQLEKSTESERKTTPIESTKLVPRKDHNPSPTKRQRSDRVTTGST